MWIVISGSLVDTVAGGGFEFFGPFANAEAARAYRDGRLQRHAEVSRDQDDMLILCVELLTPR